MLITLPDFVALDQMGEPTAYRLYYAEIQRIPHLDREQLQEMILHARDGDLDARSKLIEHLLFYVWTKAWKIYHERQPEHIDILDLVGVGNLALIESLDHALVHNDPIAYMTAVCARAIYNECVYRAALIQKPEQNNAVLDRRSAPVSVVSMDGPIYDKDGIPFSVEDIEAPPQVAELDEQRTTHRFAPLYDAVKRLPPRQRATVIRMYGFFGQPAETAEEISQALRVLPRTVWNNGFHARQTLRVWLADSLKRMLCPKPESESA